MGLFGRLEICFFNNWQMKKKNDGVMLLILNFGKLFACISSLSTVKNDFWFFAFLREATMTYTEDVLIL